MSEKSDEADTDTDPPFIADTGDVPEVEVHTITMACDGVAPAARAWHAAGWFQVEPAWELADRTIGRGMIVVGGLPASEGVPPPEGPNAPQPLGDVWVFDVTNVDAVRCPWVRVRDASGVGWASVPARWGASLAMHDGAPLVLASGQLMGGYEVAGGVVRTVEGGLQLNVQEIGGQLRLTSAMATGPLPLWWTPEADGDPACDPVQGEVSSECIAGACPEDPQDTDPPPPVVAAVVAHAPCEPPLAQDLIEDYPGQCGPHRANPNNNAIPWCLVQQDPACDPDPTRRFPGVALGLVDTISLGPDVLGGVSGCSPLTSEGCLAWRGNEAGEVDHGLPHPNDLSDPGVAGGRRLVASSVRSAFGGGPWPVDQPLPPVGAHDRPGLWGAAAAHLGRRWDDELGQWVVQGPERLLVFGGSFATGASPRWVHELQPGPVQTHCFSCCAGGPECYNPVDELYPIPCAVPRATWDGHLWHHDPAPSMGTGRMLLDSESLHRWDPTNGWSRVGSFPARIGAAATALAQDDALVVGGLNAAGQPTPQMFRWKKGNVYSVGLLKAEEAGSPPARSVAGATAVLDPPTGQVYVYGGSQQASPLRVDPFADAYRLRDRAQVDLVGTVFYRLRDTDPFPGDGGLIPSSPDALWVEQTAELEVHCTTARCTLDELDLYLMNVTLPEYDGVNVLRTLQDVEAHVRVGLDGVHPAGAPASWPVPTPVVVARTDDGVAVSEDWVRCLNPAFNCSTVDKDVGMRSRVRLPFVARDGDVVRLWVSYRVSLRTTGTLHSPSLGVRTEFLAPGCAVSVIGIPALIGTPRVPRRATDAPRPASDVFRTSFSAKVADLPRSALSTPEVEIEATYASEAYAIPSGAPVGPFGVNGVPLWSIQQAGRGLLGTHTTWYHPSCSHPLFEPTYLGVFTSPGGHIVHAHAIDLTAAQRAAVTADYLTAPGGLGADVDYARGFAETLFSNSTHVVFARRPLQDFEGHSYGLDTVMVYTDAAGALDPVITPITVRHELLHAYDWAVPSHLPNARLAPDWVLHPLIAATGRSAAFARARAVRSDDLTASHERAMNRLGWPNCATSFPSSFRSAQAPANVLLQAAAANAGAPGGSMATASSRAVQDFAIRRVFEELRVRSAPAAGKPTRLRALGPNEFASLFDDLTGVPGLYTAFSPPDDPGTVCAGFPVVAIQEVDLAAGTITFAQVQQGFIQSGNTTERYKTRFPAVPVHLTCEVLGAPLVGGPCADPSFGAEIRPLLLIPDGTGRTTLPLPGPITDELTTRLTQADGLHVGLPPLVATEQRWCTGLPPGACDADADGDGHPTRTDCVDANPLRHPGATFVPGQPGAMACPANPGEACSLVDVDCNCYTFTKDIGRFSVGSLGDGAGACVEAP